MNKNLKITVTAIILLISFLLLSVIGTNVYAAEETLSVTNVKIAEKSDTAEFGSLSFENTEINCNVIFHKVDDYVKYEIEVKNNSDKDYKVKAITNNNDSEYIIYDGSESIDTKIKANDTAIIYITAKYSKAVDDIANRSQEMNVDFEITLEDDLGNTLTEKISINPKTGDPIIAYIAIFIASACAIIILAITGKKVKNNKKVLGLIIAIILVVPVIVNAAENGITLNLKNKFELQDKIILTYVDNSGEEKTKVVNYGESITVLQPIEIEGYNHTGWYDENDKKVEKITKDVKVTAKLEPIEYTITYVLNDGTLDTPISTYTIETDTFTLPIPKKEGYVFTGWTGSNGDTPEREVTISKGSTGNKTYTANYIEYDGPSDTQSYIPSGGYLVFGAHTADWGVFIGSGSTYPWPENLAIIVFENPISRARLGFSPDGYVTYNTQNYLHGNVSNDRMTMWFDDYHGHSVDGYYTVGYTENGIDHEIQFRVVSAQVVSLEVIY